MFKPIINHSIEYSKMDLYPYASNKATQRAHLSNGKKIRFEFPRKFLDFIQDRGFKHT